MKKIFTLIVVLIVYGSLYPFHFSFEPLSNESIQSLFNFNLTKTRFSDLVGNVVLFIPFGLMLRLTFSGVKGRKALALALFLSFLFAYAIQVLQLWAIGRLSWGGDAIWNLVGCYIGFLLYSAINLDVFYKISALSTIKKVSFTLAVLLVCLKLAPFVPSIDWQLFKDNVKGLLANPHIDGYKVFEYTLLWLVVFHLIRFANAKWADVFRFSVIIIMVLALKFIIVSSDIHFSQILAGALSLCVWLFLSNRITTKILAGLMLLIVLGNGLHPFILLDQPIGFYWKPFDASLNGHFLVNIIAFSTKLVFYGTSIWLLFLATNQLKYSVLLCFVVVLLSEILQTFIVDSVPDITDAVLVLFIAYIFSHIVKSRAVS